MEHLPAGSRASMGMIQGCLVVPVQPDLYDDLLVRIRRSILNRVSSKNVSGVVFDMSSVRVMDSFVFNHLMDTGKMVLLLGVPAAFIGFQAGAVSALIDLEVDTNAIDSYHTIDEAINALTAGKSDPSEEDEESTSVNQADEAWESALHGYEPDE